jgi:hypothetical protein
MSYSDAFALKNSGLNAFLFAEVGTELNGSPLTILSILARLGRDPWAEAARWAEMPKPAMIDCLAYSIAQMPLCPQALVEARVTASRLVMLLPAPNATARRIESAAAISSAMPKWALAALFFGALAFGMVVINAIQVSGPPTTVSAPTAQTVGTTP